MCKECCIDGNATLTIVKSRTTTNWAIAKVARRAVPPFRPFDVSPTFPGEGPLTLLGSRDRAHAPVEVDRSAGDESRSRREEEGDEVRVILPAADATERDSRGHLGVKRFERDPGGGSPRDGLAA